MGLGQADIPAAPQPEAADTLRQGAFDAGAARVALLPGFGLLFRSPGLQRFMLKTRGNRQGTRTGLRMRTHTLARACRARGLGKADANNRVAPVIVGLRPAFAGLAVRALGAPLVPADRERADIEAVGTPGMPAGIQQRRADQLDA